MVHRLSHACWGPKKAPRKVAFKPRDKHLATTTSALIEFQKAQCFFMLAINIAAQVNKVKGGLQPTSLQQLYNNYILIKVISINGFLPTTFTMFTIHLVGMLSWYLIILTVLATAISTATLVVVGQFVPSAEDLKYLSQQSAIGGPTECGGNNLLVYCLDTLGDQNGYDFESKLSSTSEDSDPTDTAFAILAFCLVVLVLLILDHAKVFKKLSRYRTQPSSSRVLNFVAANFWDSGVCSSCLCYFRALC